LVLRRKGKPFMRTLLMALSLTSFVLFEIKGFGIRAGLVVIPNEVSFVNANFSVAANEFDKQLHESFEHPVRDDPRSRSKKKRKEFS